MCEIKDLTKCEKRVFVVLKSGRVYSSGWFDDNTEKADGCVNSTTKEIEVLEELKKKYNYTEDEIERWNVNRKKNNTTVYVSDHAFERMRSRVGLSKKSAIRMARKIYDNGKRAGELTGKTKLWVSEIANKHPGMADEYVVYGNFLYVFNQRIMVTVYHMPGAVAV